MEQDILISVIVPVYNVEQYLPKCVDSILNQTYRNLEVILVDDGTKDSSDRICDAYALQDPRVRVIHKRNGGLSSARNAGIDIASGEYIGFIDSDDWIAPEMYEIMLEAAVKNNTKLVCAGRYDVDGETGAETIGLCPPADEVISGVELVRRIFTWQNIDSAAWDKLYHRSLFREIRYPVGIVSEDTPVTYRIALDAGRASMVHKPVYYYLHRPGSITTASVTEKTFHFSRNAEKVYADIRERAPELEPEARYFRVRSLAYNVISLDLAGASAREQFRDQEQQSRMLLREQIGFILTSPLFSVKEKRDDLLLACGLYRPAFAVYRKLKKLRS